MMNNSDYNRLDGITKKYVDFRISGLTFSGGGTGSGSSGSSGSSGTSGAVGSSGSSGTSGVNGSSGSSGTSGANGSSGSSGTSGVNGSSGSSGSSGVNGSSGSSGSSGTSGSSPNQNLSQTLSLGNTGSTILLENGTNLQPSYSFANSTDTGLYQSSNEVRVAADGTFSLQITNISTRFLDGTALLPSISFIGDNDTGIFRATGNQLAISAGGLRKAIFSSTAIELEDETYFTTGSAATPSISFSADTDTGIYRSAAATIGFSSGGQLVMSATAGLLLGLNGDATTPAIRWATGQGFYRSSASNVRLSISGANAWGVALLAGVYQTQHDLGTSATPSISFLNDTDTGIYRSGTNQLAISAGGLTAAIFGSTNSIISSLTTGRVRTDSGILSNFTETGSIGLTIDGGGSAITTGLKTYLTIPFNCVITGWTIIADQSGSIVIDVWKDTYANYPPTVADSIAGTEKPTLSSQNKNEDNTLTTWTTTINSGDILAFNVDSASTLTKVNLIIKINKS